jgi:hypothetical protein
MLCGDTSMIDCPVRSGVTTVCCSSLLSEAGKGIDTSKVEPSPGLLSSAMRPPIRLTMRSEMLKPRPVPPKFLPMRSSACSNSRKILS